MPTSATFISPQRTQGTAPDAEYSEVFACKIQRDGGAEDEVCEWLSHFR